MSIETGIKVILFDLGGVLVELDGLPFLPEWLDDVVEEAENWRLWAQHPSVEALESGLISPPEFAQNIIDNLNLKVDASSFLTRFANWPKGLYEGVPELLQKLEPHFALACYSNTSTLHWSKMMNEMNLQTLLHHHYASFLLGCYKPSIEGFKKIKQDLKVEPGSIFFLDDNVRNVQAARSIGIQAEHVKGLDAVVDCLSAKQLLPQ